MKPRTCETCKDNNDAELRMLNQRCRKCVARWWDKNKNFSYWRPRCPRRRWPRVLLCIAIPTILLVSWFFITVHTAQGKALSYNRDPQITDTLITREDYIIKIKRKHIRIRKIRTYEFYQFGHCVVGGGVDMDSGLLDKNMLIYCCGCGEKVEARLTTGSEIYPHRADLAELPFWKCDICGNYVGCHHKTKDRTRPLGCIPTQEIKDARKHIHVLLDSIWRSKKMKRKDVYALLGKKTGRNYHTANIRSVEEAREVYKILKQINVEGR